MYFILDVTAKLSLHKNIGTRYMLIDFTPEQRVLTVFIYLITLCLHKMSNRFRSQCFKNEKKWIVTTVFAPFKEKFKKNSL